MTKTITIDVHALEALHRSAFALATIIMTILPDTLVPHVEAYIAGKPTPFADIVKDTVEIIEHERQQEE